MSAFSILLLVVPIAVIIGISRNQRRLSAIRSETVHLRADELGVKRTLADGREEEVDWFEITEIEVVRAGKGAHGAYGGVLVLGADDTRGCLVPLDRIDDSGIRDALPRLIPGFDRSRLEAAIRAKPPARVSIWVRPGHENISGEDIS